MTEAISDQQTENNGLLNAPTRQRNISTSTTGHQQIHTDEEDTDPDMEFGDGHDYDVYTMDPSDAAKRNKKKRNKDGKSFLALTSPNGSNPKQTSQYQHEENAKKAKRKKYFGALLCLFLLILAAGGVVFLYSYLSQKDAPDSEAPQVIKSEDPTVSPTLQPSLYPTLLPSLNPSSNPTKIPTNYPTLNPSQDPSSNPTVSPSANPSTNPSLNPSSSPTKMPSESPSSGPSNNPTASPSLQPSTHPSISPSYMPSQTPTNNPSHKPSATPTSNPSRDPTISPTDTPSRNPTSSPSKAPSNVPTTDPSRSPTKSPSTNPTKVPTENPSVSPTKNPSVPPTTSPSNNPSVSPTNQPTASPTAMILQVGNTVEEARITMTFPENAFIDSKLTITWGEADASTKAIFDDTTSAFQAASITDLTTNAIHFIVENPPLPTADIVYNTIIPIPDELLDPVICPPNEYGYEIFTKMSQTGFGNTIFPIFVLFESFFDPDSNPKTLTTDLFPEMFAPVDTNNPDGPVQADIIMSCTPGVNIIPIRRRLSLQTQLQFEEEYKQLRRLLQVNDYSNCKATPILCPLESKFCIKSKAYGRDHYGVDWKASNENIIAAADGTIERSEISQTYGEVIIIRHDDGSATLYGKLQSRASITTLGATVTQGTVIGVSGDSHLHFEYIPNGRIYATKKRIDVSNCIPSNPIPTPQPTQPGDTFPPTVPTFQPSKSPLIPPSTHPPTAEPSVSPTSAPTPLPSGSITVRDSGRLADDSFAVWIDQEFRVCETEIGQLNTCAINFLRPGLHTLTLEVLVAPDLFGTFHVQLADGWTFTDGTTSKDAIRDMPGETPPPGWKGSWDFNVPPATANNNAAVLGPP
eukprot:CAMPEP_0201596210 /NCGR_PEP_ID=MMETSP0190_2-20130828/192967_1 /ASSEMBLY_ACC=CAM_ASM_000263 /TAXON_ID=37353 /ORGANISM="Rosalina sp." /LENGTH=861 /DNA_ID=CAMNT_0048056477 /DNA_START=67 /DNA_END=2652 /DNA_ORIENTATION=-